MVAVATLSLARWAWQVPPQVDRGGAHPEFQGLVPLGHPAADLQGEINERLCRVVIAYGPHRCLPVCATYTQIPTQSVFNYRRSSGVTHEMDLKLFFNDVRTAWDLAAHEQVADGYKILDAGLCIAEAPPQQPWSFDLSHRYRMALIAYADVHKLAREVPEELFSDLLAPAGVWQLARRLLRIDEALNAAEPVSAALLDAAFQHHWDALRSHLAGLAGPQGLVPMLRRALERARREHSWLCAVEVNGSGSLIGLAEALGEQGASRETGLATLLSHLLEVLVTLVGPELTRNLASEAWPKTRLAACDFDVAQWEEAPIQ